MAIALANDDGTNSIPRISTGNDATSFACNTGGSANTGLYTPGNDSLLLAWFATSNAIEPSSVTGHGLSYTKIVGTSTSNVGQSSIWGAISGSSPDSTALTVNYGSTVSDIVLYDLEFTGVEVSGGVGGAIVQNQIGSSSTSVTTINCTLSAAGNANNRPVAGCFIAANEAITEDSNYVEVHDTGHSALVRRLSVSFQSGGFDTTVTHSWTSSVAVQSRAIELLASGGTPSVTATDDFGMSGFFGV